MAHEHPPQPAPQQSNNWVASPQYRIVHSNFFRYRINVGEVMLHFDTITDTGVAPNSAAVVVGEVSVALSWTQLKSLVRTMEMVLAQVEQEIGPIVLPTPALGALQASDDQIRKTLLNVYGRTTPT